MATIPYLARSGGDPPVVMTDRTLCRWLRSLARRGDPWLVLASDVFRCGLQEAPEQAKDVIRKRAVLLLAANVTPSPNTLVWVMALVQSGREERAELAGDEAAQADAREKCIALCRYADTMAPRTPAPRRINPTASHRVRGTKAIRTTRARERRCPCSRRTPKTAASSGDPSSPGDEPPGAPEAPRDGGWS